MDENDKLKAELAAEKKRTAAAIARNARLWARLEAEEAENRRLRPVVDKAKAWRARILSDGEYATEDADDLAAAVDALGTDAADGAGTGEQVRWRDEWRVSTLGHYRRAATERHSWSDESSLEGAISAYRLCVAEGTLTEPISWREPWIEHRRTAETAWQRIEPAASPAGSSTADEGAAR